MKLMDWLKKSSESKFNRFKERKNNFEKYIDVSSLKYYKKKKRDFKNNPNFFNDYKNLSLVLIHCLLKRTNVIFYTAEYDALINVMNWVESTTQELTFKDFIIKKLGREGRRKIGSGKYQFNFKVKRLDFLKLNKNLLADFLARDWKKGGFYFKIKFWDDKKRNILKF